MRPAFGKRNSNRGSGGLGWRPLLVLGVENEPRPLGLGAVHLASESERALTEERGEEISAALKTGDR